MHRTLFVLLPLCLAACEDTDTLTAKTTGAYVETKDISQTGDPSYLTKGCDSQGEPVVQIDPRLKSGMKINTTTKVQTDGVGVGSLSVSTEITSLTSTTLTQKYTVNKVANYSGYTASSSFNISCDLSSGGASCSSSDAPQNTGAEHLKYEDCGFTSEPLVTGKLTMGNYTFKGGPEVSAYKLTLQGVGSIKCGNDVFENAKLEYTLLTSNELPSTDFNFCGGTMISFYTKLTAGEKTLKVTFSERTEAALASTLSAQDKSNVGPELPAFYFSDQINGDYLKLRPSLLRMFTNL